MKLPSKYTVLCCKHMNDTATKLWGMAHGIKTHWEVFNELCYLACTCAQYKSKHDWVQ